MSVKQYRKKPVVIEAMLFDGTNGDATAKWCSGVYNFLPHHGDHGESISHIRIDTLEGQMLANVGDYIIKGVKGEFYSCKPDIFEATYEAVL